MTESANLNELLGKSVGLLIAVIIVSLILCIYALICNFKIFKKAGINPWLSLVPIVNIFKFLQIAGLSGKYFILFFIPIANIYALIKMYYEISKRFGCGATMAILYFFVPVIPMYIFAFKAEYVDIKPKEQETYMRNFTSEVQDNLAGFVPVQGEGAVPFEEGMVAYNNTAPELSEEDIQNINQTFADLNAAKEAEEQAERERIAAEEAKKAEEYAKKTSFFANVPEEEKPQAYQQESAQVNAQSVQVPENKIEEPQTIVIPTGENPDGINIPVVPTQVEQPVQQPQEKVCPKCGMKLDPQAVTCFMCGTNL